MALLDLSLPTRTLVRLVTEAMNVSPVKPTPGPVTITSLAPDLLQQTDNAIGIYLYHVVEDAAYRNQTWPKRPTHPRFNPMGLNLHYIVSSHSNLTEPFGPYREQLLMGIAMKALHDYPVIDEFTEIGGTKILDPSLSGDDNILRLSLRQVPASEAISYWTAGSQPLRLSAYYEISVALIEPDEPTLAGGRVLTHGIETFVGGLPRLSTSRSTVTFLIPGETADREVQVQPAQVAIGDEMTLVGTGLGGGTLSLRVRNPSWAAPLTVGPTWGVSGGNDLVYATVQDFIDSEPALPGSYSASVAIERSDTLPDGTSHSFTVTSNETPFQIVPAVELVSAVVGGQFTITGKVFSHATSLPAPGSVQMSIGSSYLVEHAAPLAAGQFRVVSPTEIEATLPSTALPGTSLPFRIIINGAESAPRWVTVP